MACRCVVTLLLAATSTLSAQGGATAPAEIVHAQRLKQRGDSLTPGEQITYIAFKVAAPPAVRSP